jgi:hypothetical protein
MSKTAKIESNLVSVRPVERQDDGTLWLILDIPNGWDDVKKICKKVLSYEGRTYVFMSWNSDNDTCAFKACANVARIVKR